MGRCASDNLGVLNIFPERLNAVMERRKMSPGMVAIRTGMNERSIRNYMQGICQPSAYGMKMLAKGLGVSADWLLGLTEEEKL